MAFRNDLISDSANLPGPWYKVQGQDVEMSDDANHLKYVDCG